MSIRLSYALLAATVICGVLRAETWNVGILVYPGVYNTEFVAPYDIFDHADRPEHRIRVFLIAPDKEPILSAEGMRVAPDYTFEEHPSVDILIVPSFEKYLDDLKGRPAVIDWIRKTAEGSKWVLSNCWGAFYLAQAGLLDGRSAMTYPPDLDNFQKRFPRVKVLHRYRFVRDGKFVTGAGGIASYDNALYVVEKQWGKGLARRIARGLIIDWDLDSIPHFLSKKP